MKKIIVLGTREPTCRCCGKGTTFICNDCHKLLSKGYTVFIECKDVATPDKLKPTGLAIAWNVREFPFKETVTIDDKSISDGHKGNTIQFVRKSDLKQFLNGDYESIRNSSITGGNRSNINSKTTDST